MRWVALVALAALLLFTTAATAAGAGPTRRELRVTNPASGASLYVAVYQPGGDGPFPALVLMPGGITAGSDTFERRPVAAGLAEDGFVVVVFDPDGRGRSGGVEDAGGMIHQEGLAAVIRTAASLPAVDPARLGLVTYSFGITAGSGALSRHPDLPVQFLIDWEGPADRYTTGCRGPRRGALSRSCDDDAYWSEREAATFLRELRIPYQRIQTADDHVHGADAAHAAQLVTAATSGAHGGSGIAPWTRLNDEPPNRVYTASSLPPLPEEAGRGWLEERVSRYARELSGAGGGALSP